MIDYHINLLGSILEIVRQKSVQVLFHLMLSTVIKCIRLNGISQETVNNNHEKSKWNLSTPKMGNTVALLFRSKCIGHSMDSIRVIYFFIASILRTQNVYQTIQDILCALLIRNAINCVQYTASKCIEAFIIAYYAMGKYKNNTIQ